MVNFYYFSRRLFYFILLILSLGFYRVESLNVADDEIKKDLHFNSFSFLKKSSPPDLEELWKNFNQRLNKFFFNRLFFRQNLNNFRGKKKSKVGLLTLLFLVFIGWFSSGVYIVHEGQVGVVLRFGKYVYTTNPGIQWRFPYPIESNEIVNMTKVRSVEIGRKNISQETNLNDASMLTADENIIDVRFAVQYRIKNAADFLFNNVDAEANVSQAAETAVREIVGKSKMDTVLYEGREQVAVDLANLIQRILDAYKTGIVVSNVAVHNVQPPSQVQAAFDDVVKATQDVESQIHEAYAYANKIIPMAEGMATRMKEEAIAYRERRLEEANGDISRFAAIAAEYKKSPHVTRERLYIETMQDVYLQAVKVLLPSQQGSNVVYLPLDKNFFQNRELQFSQENLFEKKETRSDLKDGSFANGKKHDPVLTKSKSLTGSVPARSNDRRYDVISDLLGKR